MSATAYPYKIPYPRRPYTRNELRDMSDEELGFKLLNETQNQAQIRTEFHFRIDMVNTTPGDLMHYLLRRLDTYVQLNTPPPAQPQPIRDQPVEAWRRRPDPARDQRVSAIFQNMELRNAWIRMALLDGYDGSGLDNPAERVAQLKRTISRPQDDWNTLSDTAHRLYGVVSRYIQEWYLTTKGEIPDQLHD